MGWINGSPPVNTTHLQPLPISPILAMICSSVISVYRLWSVSQNSQARLQPDSRTNAEA